MEYFSLPYVAVVFVYTCLFFIYRKKSNILFLRVLCAVIYILFFGFSGLIGSDWYNYHYFYIYGSSSGRFEVGFEYLVDICNYIGINYYGFKLLIYIIQAYLIDKVFVRYLNNKIPLFYIALIAIAPLLIIDTLRNFLGMLISYLGVYYFTNKKHMLAFGLVLLATLFHSTSILYFIFYILCGKYFNKKVIVFLLVLSIPFIFGFINISSIFSNVFSLLSSFGGYYIFKYSNYLNTTSSYGLTFGMIEKVFFAVLFIIKYNDITNNKRIPPILFNFSFIYILVYFYGTSAEFLINRFSLLFVCGYIVTIIITISSFNFKVNKLFFYSLVFMLLFLKVTLSLNNILYQYNNIIFMNDSYNDRLSNRNTYYINR